MNLEQIRNKILIQHNYVPNSTTYFGYVNNIINEAYVELFTSQPWSFNQKVVDYRIVPDVSPTTLEAEHQAGTGTTASLDLALGLQFQQDEIYLSSSNANFPGSLFQPFVGNSIEIGGFDYNIISSYNYTTGSGVSRAVISPKFEGITSQDSSSFILKKKYYNMPLDLVEIMDIGFRDDRVGYGNIPNKMISIPRRMDTTFGLSYQMTADVPNCYIPDGETAQLPAPVVAPTLYTSSVASSFALPTGTHKIAYTYSSVPNGYIWAGSDLMNQDAVESAMSPTASVEITNSTSSIIFDYSSLYIPTGMYLNIYLAIENTGIDNRVFYVPFGGNWRLGNNPQQPQGLIESINPAESSVLYLANLTSLLYPRPPYQTRFSNTNGRAKRIRFYPRPVGGSSALYSYNTTGSTGTIDQHKFFQVRYIYRPNNLEFDTDVPEFPEEFHYLLTDRVLIDLYNREGKTGQAELHQKKYDERIKFLRARYGTEKDTIAVRRSGWERTGYDPYVVYPSPAVYRPGGTN